MIIGVDFGAPRLAKLQRRKIVAMGAYAVAARTYRVDTSGVNARLLGRGNPGWSATELRDALLDQPARVVAFDFPFSLPIALLNDARFAFDAGYTKGAFEDWCTFNAFVAAQLPLRDPLDFAPFCAWRAPTERARLWAKRATDVAASAQPPLKDKFQATFQMTLLGNALLFALRSSQRYRAVLTPAQRRHDQRDRDKRFASRSAIERGNAGALIEVYPGATLRSFRLAAYKSRPIEAIRRSIAACAAEGIELSVAPEVIKRCTEYNSNAGTNNPDYDIADAFVALCTGILYAEGACIAACPTGIASAQLAAEGAIWVPDDRLKRAFAS